MDFTIVGCARRCKVLVLLVLLGSLVLCFPLSGPAGPGQDSGASRSGMQPGSLGALASLQQDAAEMNLEATGILADAVLSGAEEEDASGNASAALALLPSTDAALAVPVVSGEELVEEEDTELAEIAVEAAGLPVPSGLTVVQYGRDYLLQWNPVNDSRVSGYYVYRSFFSSPKMRRGKRLNKEPVRDPGYFDTTVKNRKRKQYYSVCCADMSARPGPRSEGVVILPWLPDSNPPAQVGLMDAGFVDEGLSAAWTASNREPDFNGYNLYLSDAQGKLGARLTPSPVKDTFFFAEGLTPGTNPQYLAARSVDTTGNESAWSQTTPALCPARIYEDDAPEIAAVGFWKRENYPEAHAGAIAVAADAGSSLELAFTGRSVKLFSASYWTCGTADIYLDGQLVAEVDQYSAVTRYNVLAYSNNRLRPGTHVIRIVGAGQAASTEQEKASAGYHFCNLDYLLIR